MNGFSSVSRRPVLKALATSAALLGMPHLSRAATQKLTVAKSISDLMAYTPIDVGLAKGIYEKHGIELDVITFTGSALDFYTAQSNVLNFIADKSNAAQAEIDALAPFTSDGIAVTDDEGYTDAFAAVLAETDTYLAGLI